MIGNNGSMGQQPQSPTTLNFNPFVTQQTQCNLSILLTHKINNFSC